MQLFVVSLRSTWSGHQPLSYIVVRRTPTERLVVDLELLPREELECIVAINKYMERDAELTWVQNNLYLKWIPISGYNRCMGPAKT